MMGIETYAQRCHQKWASDLHFHWKLSFFFLNIFHFHLNLLDPRVIVIDSRATCLKVRERSDRRGKLPAWPSDATAMIRQIRHEIRHIDIICASGISHWPCVFVFGYHWPRPPQNKVGRLLKDDREICSSHGFRMTSVCMA